jgi:hypothetical protein
LFVPIAPHAKVAAKISRGALEVPFYAQSGATAAPVENRIIWTLPGLSEEIERWRRPLSTLLNIKDGFEEAGILSQGQKPFRSRLVSWVCQ